MSIVNQGLVCIGLAACAALACSSTDGDVDLETAANNETDAGGEDGGPGEHLACEGRVSSSKPCSSDPNPCGIDSGFEGDEYCLLPPPEGKGIQIHFGPSNYEDAAEVAKYTIEPGEEFNAYGIAHVPLDGDRWYNRVQIQMRPGSHHLINSVVEGKPQEGYAPEGSDCPGTRLAGFPGTQNLVLDSPPKGIPAPENEGLGRLLPGDSSICHNHHAYNFTEETQLREIWMNVWFVDESEVTQRASGISVVAGPFQGIPPGTRETIRHTAGVNGTGRILSLFGHRHAWTERFAVWKNEDLIYDSWDWEESVVFSYNSVTENPQPNPGAKTDGAATGIIEIAEGDDITFECDINNESNKTLTFQNALYDGEMCILFGQSIDATIQ